MNRHIKYPCELCGELIVNKRKHRKVCTVIASMRTERGGYRQTEEQKRIKSEKRKEFLKNNPDKHPWKKHSKFISEPCEKLKNILSERGFLFFAEYTDAKWDKNYSIDIAFPEKKIGIEINGNQHYESSGKLREYYQKRHDWLSEKGWVLYEVPYIDVYRSNVVETLINYITNGIMQNVVFEYHPKAKKEKKDYQKLMEEARKNGLIRKDGKINWNGVSTQEYERRKQLILNSGVDLSKFGWVQKVSKITGLTIRKIEKTINHYKKEFSGCFYRKGSLILIRDVFA